MPFGLLLLALAGYVVYQKSRGGGGVGAGGAPGTIVDVSPILGQRSANVTQGQTVRVNLPKEWFLLQDPSVDPNTTPLQPVPARGLGGMTFTAAMAGQQRLTFFKHGSLLQIDLDINVAPVATASWAAGYRVYRPYREFWGRLRAIDPYWRVRETQWRLHRRWDPAWGTPPPPQADPVVDVVDPPAA
jgi:hypothetical protein